VSVQIDYTIDALYLEEFINTLDETPIVLCKSNKHVLLCKCVQWEGEKEREREREKRASERKSLVKMWTWTRSENGILRDETWGFFGL